MQSIQSETPSSETLLASSRDIQKVHSPQVNMKSPRIVLKKTEHAWTQRPVSTEPKTEKLEPAQQQPEPSREKTESPTMKDLQTQDQKPENLKRSVSDTPEVTKEEMETENQEPKTPEKSQTSQEIKTQPMAVQESPQKQGEELFHIGMRLLETFKLSCLKDVVESASKESISKPDENQPTSSSKMQMLESKPAVKSETKSKASTKNLKSKSGIYINLPFIFYPRKEDDTYFDISSSDNESVGEIVKKDATFDSITPVHTKSEITSPELIKKRSVEENPQSSSSKLEGNSISKLPNPKKYYLNFNDAEVLFYYVLKISLNEMNLFYKNDKFFVTCIYDLFESYFSFGKVLGGICEF